MNIFSRKGFKKTRRHIHRYREIISIFLKYGFRDFITRGHIRGVPAGEKQKASKSGKINLKQYSHWERVRMALEELGPTFIKLGQIMSNRPDLLAPELILELEKLQTRVPPFPYDEAKKLIEAELGKPLRTVFARFDLEPVASASIAQAHKARLKSGEEVIVKVQRPNIEETINTDIEILKRLAGIFEHLILQAETLDAVNVIDEFGKSLNREIDFINEAMHIEKFAANFQEESSLVVPAVFRDYSSKRVLTMEFIDGTHVSELKRLHEKGIDTKKIADTGTRLVLEQIFEHGFFHADPHPGNVMVLDDERVCFLDFGMMGMILPKHRNYLSNIMVGIVNQDAGGITKSLIDFSRSENIENRENLEYEIFVLSEQYSHLPLKDINMGDLLPKMLSVILDYELRLPANIFMLTKALITIEGVGRRLDPEYDLMSHIEPFAKQLIRRRFKADRLKKDALSAAVRMRDLLADLPDDTKEIIKVLKSGKTKIDFERGGLQQVFRRLGNITNRLTLSIVFASLVIGSALMFNSMVPPLWRGIPVIGLAGLGGAVITGVLLFVTILRKNRL
jgi:ubiquinone biosynthesis protein